MHGNWPAIYRKDTASIEIYWDCHHCHGVVVIIHVGTNLIHLFDVNWLVPNYIHL